MTATVILLLLSSLALGGVGTIVFRRLEAAGGEPRPLPRAAWGWAEAILALLLPVMLGMILYRIAAPFEKGPDDVVPSLVVQGASASLAVAAVVWLASRAPGFRRSQLGAQPLGGTRIVALGIASWFAFLPAFALANLANGAAHQLLGLPMEIQTPVEGLAHEGNPAVVGLLVLLIVGVIPVVEEVTFRGIVHGAVRKHLGRGMAIAASSVVFAALHGRSPFLPILAIGILLAWVYERTGSILAPVAAHILHNGVVTGMVLAFPDLALGKPAEASVLLGIGVGLGLH